MTLYVHTSWLFWRSWLGFTIGLASLVTYATLSWSIDILPALMVGLFVLANGLNGKVDLRSIGLMGIAVLPLTLSLLFLPPSPTLQVVHTVSVFTYAALLPFAFFFSPLRFVIYKGCALLYGVVDDAYAQAILHKAIHTLVNRDTRAAPAGLELSIGNSYQSQPTCVQAPGKITRMPGSAFNLERDPVDVRRFLEGFHRHQVGLAIGAHTTHTLAFQESAHDALLRLGKMKTQPTSLETL